MTLKNGEHDNYNEALRLMGEGKVNDLENAKEKLTKLVNAYDTCIDLRFLLVATHQMLGNYDISIKEIEKIRDEQRPTLCESRYKSIDAVKAWACHNLGIAYYRKEDYCRAEASFIKSTEFNLIRDTDIKDPRFFSDLGQFHHGLERYDDAETEFCKALVNIENIYSYKIKNPGIELGIPLDKLEDIRQEVKLYLGRVYYKKGNWKKAENIFHEALLYFDKNLDKKPLQEELRVASILIDIAQLELDEEHNDAAKGYLDRASTTYSSKWPYIKDLPMQKISVELDNTSAIYNNLGIICYNQGNYDKAKEHFIKALEYKHHSATTNNNLANVYAKMGDIESAVSLYQQALVIKPELKAARENIKLLWKKEPIGWWDWWFHSDPWLKDAKPGKGLWFGKNPGMGLWKGFLGILLVAVLFLLLASALTPMLGGGYTEVNTTVINSTMNPSVSKPLFNDYNETTIIKTETNATSNTNIKTNTNEATYRAPTIMITTTQTKSSVSPEIRLLFAALVVFMLIHPQIRGFSAGAIKLDLEPMAVSKGPSDQFKSTTQIPIGIR